MGFNSGFKGLIAPLDDEEWFSCYCGYSTLWGEVSATHWMGESEPRRRIDCSA